VESADRARLLTVQEVAAELRVSPGWVYAHARGERRPHLRAFRPRGESRKGPVRFRTEDLERFIEEWCQ